MLKVKSLQDFPKILAVILFFHFYCSILCDGSTDSAVIEKECIYVIFVDPDTFQPTVSFFSLQEPLSQDANGLHECIKTAFQIHGLAEAYEKIVFFASDGSSVNCGIKNGLIMLIKEELPWVSFLWCVAHRLELALKDSLKTWMEPINVCLMNLYYMYQKSSKKLREVKVLHNILKETYQFENGSVKPVRATGTRWIGHKLDAMR